MHHQIPVKKPIKNQSFGHTTSPIDNRHAPSDVDFCRAYQLLDSLQVFGVQKDDILSASVQLGILKVQLSRWWPASKAVNRDRGHAQGTFWQRILQKIAQSPTSETEDLTNARPLQQQFLDQTNIVRQLQQLSSQHLGNVTEHFQAQKMHLVTYDQLLHIAGLINEGEPKGLRFQLSSLRKQDAQWLREHVFEFDELRTSAMIVDPDLAGFLDGTAQYYYRSTRAGGEAVIIQGPGFCGDCYRHINISTAGNMTYIDQTVIDRAIVMQGPACSEFISKSFGKRFSQNDCRGCQTGNQCVISDSPS